MNLISVGVFGLLGVFCRYGIDRAIGNDPFPVSTFTINILGSFLVGLIYAIGERQEISPAIQTGLIVGFCGGFTTFSAYALQTFLLMDKDKVLQGILYISLSPLLGLIAASVPILIVRKLAG